MFVIGDMNFSCNGSSPGFVMCKSVFDKLSIINCDDVFVDDNPLTYVSDHLQCSSFIDHCFVSSGLKHIVSSIDVIESGANLSDHRPIAVNCLLSAPRCLYVAECLRRVFLFGVGTDPTLAIIMLLVVH